MAYIRRGTTPTVALIVDRDISSWPTVVVSIRNGCAVSTYAKEQLEFAPSPEGDGVVIRLPLSQDDTLSLGGSCQFQVRAVDADGTAVSTCIVSARVAETINEEVL